MMVSKPEFLVLPQMQPGTFLSVASVASVASVLSVSGFFASIVAKPGNSLPY
jgi:hypothetical protein